MFFLVFFNVMVEILHKTIHLIFCFKKNAEYTFPWFDFLKLSPSEEKGNITMGIMPNKVKHVSVLQQKKSY